MKRVLAASLSLAALFSLGACGFTPVYGPPPAALAGKQGPIDVAEIEGRTGHFLRQELVRSIGPGVPGFAGPATLEIELKESMVRLGFAPDQAASRSDYVGEAKWTLRGPDGEPAARGNAREAASFNFADVAYADIAAQTAAKERVATMLARSIRDQIILAAGKPKPAASGAPQPTPAPVPEIDKGPTTAKPYSIPQPQQ
jgi:LPS-assembly lipoprotein